MMVMGKELVEKVYLCEDRVEMINMQFVMKRGKKRDIAVAYVPMVMD